MLTLISYTGNVRKQADDFPGSWTWFVTDLYSSIEYGVVGTSRVSSMEYYYELLWLGLEK